MSLFKDVLKESSTILKDPIPLDIDYIPKIVPYRENEQKYIATCIKPLFQKRNGKNIFITGSPGIGKTVAAKHVLTELDQETDDIITVYVNCWKSDTTYKVILDICHQINFKFVHNRDSSELLKEIAKILNKKSAVIVLDEVDKLNDNDIIYSLLEDIYRKTLILITNEKEWLANLDNRIRSRLMPDTIEFRPYKLEEIKGILKERISYAFAPNSVDKEAFELLVNKTFESEDLRLGLYLLKEACELAESKSSNKISLDHAQEAISKSNNFTIKPTSALDQTENEILNIVKDNAGKTTKEIYDLYISKGGKQSYSNFHRHIKNLEKGRFVSIKEENKGSGKTSIVEFGNKKISDF